MKRGPTDVMKMVTLLFAGIQHWWEEWVLPKRPLLPPPQKKKAQQHCHEHNHSN